MLRDDDRCISCRRAQAGTTKSRPRLGLCVLVAAVLTAFAFPAASLLQAQETPPPEETATSATETEAAQPEERQAPLVAQPTPQPSPDDLRQQQINLLRNVLHEDAMSPRDRQQAAAQLLQLGTPDAVAVLVEGLEASNSQAVVVAIADGLILNGPPPPALLAPILTALLEADRGTEMLLTRVLTRFDAQGVVPPLLAAAQDESHPADGDRRLRAIRALGSLYDDTAIESLIGLLRTTEGSPLRPEVLGALESSTGLEAFSAKTEDWESWWTLQRETPREQRLVNIIRTLRTEVETRDEQLDELRSRFVRMIQLLYTATPPEQRSRLLADLLQDEEASVRRTATGLVERAMGDAVALEESVTQALKQLLADSEADLRAQAARLLLNLGDPEVGTLVGQAYLLEQDLAALREFLLVLARSPQAETLDQVIAHLRQGILPALAGQALLAASDRELLTDEARAALREHLRAADPATLPASNIRLLARLGGDADRAELLPLLEGEDAGIKTALGKELALRSEFVDLLARLATDPVLHPIAMDAVLRHRANLEGARTLLGLRPTNGGNESIWLDRFALLAGRLPLSDLRTLDDEMLASDIPLIAEGAHLRLLEGALARFPAAPEQQLGQWQELLTRLATWRLEREQVGPAAEVLDLLRGSQPPGDSYKRTQTIVFLRQGRLAEAAELLPEVGLWLDVAQTLHEVQPERFAAICQAVEERFAEQLSDAQRERLTGLLALIPPPEGEATEAEAEGATAEETTPDTTQPQEPPPSEPGEDQG
jgi:hypothetical protein